MANQAKLSRWFFPITLIWIFIFCIFGIIDAGSGPPTAEKFFHWETLMVLGSPVVITALFYWLFNKINIWWVFFATLVVGGIMTFEVILQNKYNEIVFTILIWPVLIITPYYLTRLAMRSKAWLIVVLTFLIICLALQIGRIVFI